MTCFLCDSPRNVAICQDTGKPRCFSCNEAIIACRGVKFTQFATDLARTSERMLTQPDRAEGRAHAGHHFPVQPFDN